MDFWGDFYSLRHLIEQDNAELRLNLRLTAITLLQLDGQSVEILYKSRSFVVGRARFERATIALKVSKLCNSSWLKNKSNYQKLLYIKGLRTTTLQTLFFTIGQSSKKSYLSVPPVSHGAYLGVTSLA